MSCALASLPNSSPQTTKCTIHCKRSILQVRCVVLCVCVCVSVCVLSRAVMCVDPLVSALTRA